MATETTIATATTNLEVISFNVNSNQFDKPTIATSSLLVDKSYEVDSNSTTTTNSPSISPILDLPPLCACNELITSNFDCSDCGEPSFEAIQRIEDEHNQTKTQLINLQTQRDKLHQEQLQLDTHLSSLKTTLRDRQNGIEQTSNGIISLQHDLKVLEVKCKEETTQVENIQQSKENVKKELEELSQRLFEEANSMIAIEKAGQETLKNKNHQLESELKSAQLDLIEAERQLKVIRNEIEVDRQPTSDQENNQYCRVMDTYTRAQVETILMHGLDVGLQMDTLENDSALMDFNDFIQNLYKTPLRKLHGIKYMRYLIRDDIEPCLRFGPNPKLASKKIMDAILVKTCFVEECPEGFVTEQAIRQLKEEASATLWERFTTSSVFLGCQACGRTIQDKASRPQLLKYRFRISYFDEWACIDRYCRDRLLAVIEFYLFIRHLRAGLYKHRSLHELYQESTRLKLQMFLAR
jgi:hypothetical protein